MNRGRTEDWVPQEDRHLSVRSELRDLDIDSLAEVFLMYAASLGMPKPGEYELKMMERHLPRNRTPGALIEAA
jgi:hypothetical protein